ncbi:hypothetical protein ABK040_002596 [Willaertia magna]
MSKSSTTFPTDGFLTDATVSPSLFLNPSSISINSLGEREFYEPYRKENKSLFGNEFYLDLRNGQLKKQKFYVKNKEELNELIGNVKQQNEITIDKSNNQFLTPMVNRKLHKKNSNELTLNKRNNTVTIMETIESFTDVLDDLTYGNSIYETTQSCNRLYNQLVTLYNNYNKKRNIEERKLKYKRKIFIDYFKKNLKEIKKNQLKNSINYFCNLFNKQKEIKISEKDLLFLYYTIYKLKDRKNLQNYKENVISLTGNLLQQNKCCEGNKEELNISKLFKEKLFTFFKEKYFVFYRKLREQQKLLEEHILYYYEKKNIKLTKKEIILLKQKNKKLFIKLIGSSNLNNK